MKRLGTLFARSSPLIANSSVSRRLAVVAVLATLASWLCLIDVSGDAEAGVIFASASAFDLDISLTITQPPLAPLPVALGPFNAVSAVGPAGTASSTVLSLVIPTIPVITASALTSTASTSFIPGGSGTANASASIGSLTFSIPLISTSFTSGFLQSSANSTDIVVGGVDTRTIGESATIVGGSLTVLGVNLGTLAVNPAPNTIIPSALLSALGVAVVLNNNNPILAPAGTSGEVADAVDITFTNTPWNPFGGVVNGTIDIADSRAALVVTPPAFPFPPVAEPGTASLVTSGLGGMLLLSWMARRRQRDCAPMPPATQ